MDESEWQQVRPLIDQDIKDIKAHRTATGVSIQEAQRTLELKSCKLYTELTGFKEYSPSAIAHHARSHFGPECKSCGHLLRTAKATMCANCGARHFSPIETP
jgi:hypothetical protein